MKLISLQFKYKSEKLQSQNILNLCIVYLKLKIQKVRTVHNKSVKFSLISFKLNLFLS